MRRVNFCYYADERKYFLNTKTPITKFRRDKEIEQFVHVTGSIFGVEIRPDVRWTRICEKLYHENKANGVRLLHTSAAPDGSLEFVNKLKCSRLAIDEGDGLDLSPLMGNTHLEDLQVGRSVKSNAFDLTNLPNLSRCQLPLIPELMSFLKCRQLVCLGLIGGRHDGVLNLESLHLLEEFICKGVNKLKQVVFNSRVSLGSLELSHLKDFESVEPQAAMTRELRVVELNKVPRIKIEWLKDAEKVECIALRLGEIPSIRFLSELKRLQVLDLFGSKVKDKDFSVRNLLNGEMDPLLWGPARK